MRCRTCFTAVGLGLLLTACGASSIDGDGPGADGGPPASGTCAVETWDHDSNSSTPCVPWTKCAAGSYVANTPSSTVDRACAPCAAGTFTDSVNATSCAAWTACAPGSYENTAGTPSSDRTCAACSSGTFSSSANQPSCTPTNVCPAGTWQTAASTATSTTLCTTCNIGDYCAGDTATPVTCTGDTWDDDHDPATPCAAKTPCASGYGVTNFGDSVTDQTCDMCPSGTFSPEGGVCNPWQNCSAGRYRIDGTILSDATCADCPDGTFTAVANQSSCAPHTACPSGTEQTAAGTSTSQTACAPCSAGTYCPGDTTPKADCGSGFWDDDNDSKTACVPWKKCIAGEYIATVGSPTNDQTCSACTNGFSTAENTSKCNDWTTCSNDFRVDEPGTPTTDRTCVACPDGTHGYGSNATTCTSLAALAGGTDHVCALLQNGSVRCWGNNTGGQLGMGTWNFSHGPVAVADLTDAVQISAGDGYTCARQALGTVSCWGANSNGQLGNGSFWIGEYRPATVAGVANVAQIATGNWHTCAVSQGSVYCWGKNQFVFDGTPLDARLPQLVSGLSNVTGIGAGSNHTCAVTAEGSIYCWGSNLGGQLGGGTAATYETAPVLVPGITNAVEVVGGFEFTCAHLADGTVRCWGRNLEGVIAEGSQWDTQVTPNLSNVRSLSAGQRQACATVLNGSLYCWGANYSGQVGDGTTVPRATPTLVPGISNVTAATTGSSTCAASADGQVRCWGQNASGQIGDGTTTNQYSPVLVLWK